MSVFRRNLILASQSAQSDIPEGCIFWLPLDSTSQDALIDKVNGYRVERSEYDATFEPESADDGTYMYHISNPPGSRISSGSTYNHQYTAKIYTPILLNSSYFKNNEYTIIAKMKILDNDSTLHYVFTLGIKEGATFNNLWSNTFVFLAPNGSGSVSSRSDYFPEEITKYGVYVSPTKRIYTIGSNAIVLTANANQLPSNWIDLSDGYLYLGFNYEWRLVGNHFLISNIMIFNRELSLSEINTYLS